MVMKTSDVLKHYRTQVATAAALGINQSSISVWGKYPPDARQLQIEKLTSGALSAEVGCLDLLIGMTKISAKKPKGAHK